MKDYALLGIILLAIVLVGAVGYFYVMRPRTVAPSPPAAETLKPAAEVKPEPERPRVAAVRPKPAPEKAPPRPAPPSQPRTFPTEAQIPAGASRELLWRDFGAPSLRVASLAKGALVERFIYVNAERTKMTTAFLENGSVISVTTEEHHRPASAGWPLPH